MRVWACKERGVGRHQRPEASRAEAIAKFVAEIEKLAVDGTFLPDHSKVVTADDLASLRSHDPRARRSTTTR